MSWPGKYFTLGELTRSEKARARRIANTPTPEAMANLRRLVRHLDKMREIVGKPLFINSGYRNPTVNRLVGGASRSRHLVGDAVDISLEGHDRKALVKAAIEAGFTGIGLGGSFLHVDLGLRRAWPYKPKDSARWVPAFGRDPVSAVKELLRP